MITSIRTALSRMPPWGPAALTCLSLIALTAATLLLPRPDWTRRTVRVAYAGNSVMYYNDAPILLETLAPGYYVHGSCFHGATGFRSLLARGNGMSEKFRTEAALIDADAGIYDFGACTVKQLLFGSDEEVFNFTPGQADDDDDGGGRAVYYDTSGNELLVYDDGRNPCLADDDTYRRYVQARFDSEPTPRWDYLALNDIAMYMASSSSHVSRELQALQEHYVPMLLEASSTVPVLIVSQAYVKNAIDDEGNMDEPYVDVPTFTKIIIETNFRYAEALAEPLPASQRPLLAPVAVAFLTIWEEERTFWSYLFAGDGKHTSFHGAYLQGLVWYHTFYGRMPPSRAALREDMSAFFDRRRYPPRETDTDNVYVQDGKIDESGERQEVSLEEAEYMYSIAVRVCAKHHIPESLGEDSSYGSEWW